MLKIIYDSTSRSVPHCITKMKAFCIFHYFFPSSTFMYLCIVTCKNILSRKLLILYKTLLNMPFDSGRFSIILYEHTGLSHAPFSLHAGRLRRPCSGYVCCFCRLRLQKQQTYPLCERRRREECREGESPV